MERDILKNAAAYFAKESIERRLRGEHRGIWPVNVMCKTLGGWRSGFYAWRRRPSSVRARADAAILLTIRPIRTDGARGREIAVRMALGAALRTILSEFGAEAGWMTAGLLFGLAMAMIASRALTQFLCQVACIDLISVATAIGVVVLLTMFAAFLPGSRAARIGIAESGVL